MMNMLQKLALVSFCLAAILASRSTMASSIPEYGPQDPYWEPLDICEPKYRETVTSEQVEAVYNTLSMVQNENMAELLNTSQDRYVFALEDSKDNEALRKKVVLEHYDKVCGVVDAVEEMSEKVMKILG